jgi:hypothetical protein
VSVWVDKVRANFERLMQTDIAASANNLFTETKATGSLIHNATSTYNGSYSIAMTGLNVVHEINNTWLFEYNVALTLGFTINPKQRYDVDTSTVVNDKLEYNEAIEDIELIASKALSPSLYGSLLENMELRGVGPLEYSDEMETFAKCTMDFLCSGRVVV